MPRRKSVNLVRDVGTDVRYNSEVVQKFINVLMTCGKKNIARKILYDAMEIISKKCGGDQEKTLKIFYRALEQVTPVIEVKTRRVGGGMYQIPVEVNSHRGQSLAFRWIKNAAAVRSDKTMGLRLGHELLDAYEGRGVAVKKKIDVQKVAEQSRSYSHLAW